MFLPLLVTVHVTAAAIVIGVLFMQSLAVVMALRLPAEAQREGVRTLQRRVHAFVYYPILGVTLLAGLWVAMLEGAFTQGKWLHWKLLLVLVLIGLGFLTGGTLRNETPGKPRAMAVHVLIFLVSLLIVYLAVFKPF